MKMWCCRMLLPFSRGTLSRIRPVPVTFYSNKASSSDVYREVRVQKLKDYEPQFGPKLYAGNMFEMVQNIKLFSFSTSIFALTCQPIILYRMYEEKGDSMFHDALSIVQVCVTTAVSTIVLFTPIFIHKFVRRYVIDMYYDEEKKVYTAITSGFFLSRNALSFKAEDVDENTNPGMFATMYVRGRALLFVPRRDMFTNEAAFVTLMDTSKSADFEMQKRLELDLKREAGEKTAEETNPGGRVLGKKTARKDVD